MTFADFTANIDGYHSAVLRDAERKLSWCELDEESRRSLAFYVREFKRGACVGIWGANSLDYASVLVRLLRAGCIPVPLNTHLTPNELATTVCAARLDAVIAIHEFPPEHRQAIKELTVWSLNPEQMRNSKLDDTEQLFSIGAASLLICSSGSEGQIKAVQLSIRSMLQHAITVVEHLKVTPKDTWLICLPLFHVGGLAITFRSLVAGASYIITASADPEEINRRIDHGEATIVSVVPTLLAAMVAARQNKPFPSSLRAMITGGGPSTDNIIDCCPQALPTYGTTETGSMLTCTRPGCDEIERHSAGPCLPGAEIRIVNEQWEELSTGNEGYILARGPGLSMGYWNDSVRTAQYFRDDWFFTGDIGKLDERGNLHVLARRTDLILSGGENVYPSEIEQVLQKHPSVEASVVLPLPDAKWGQVPVALVVMRPEHRVHENELLSFLEKQLARYKLPRRIVFTNRLPLLANGKPDVSAIRKLITT